MDSRLVLGLNDNIMEFFFIIYLGHPSFFVRSMVGQQHTTVDYKSKETSPERSQPHTANRDSVRAEMYKAVMLGHCETLIR